MIYPLAARLITVLVTQQLMKAEIVSPYKVHKHLSVHPTYTSTAYKGYQGGRRKEIIIILNC